MVVGHWALGTALSLVSVVCPTFVHPNTPLNKPSAAIWSPNTTFE